MPIPPSRVQPRRIQWLALLGLTARWVPLLPLAHPPAAFLLRPLAAAVLASGIEGTRRIEPDAAAARRRARP